MNGRNSDDWSLFDDGDEDFGLDEEAVFFLSDDDDEVDELQVFEDIEESDEPGKEKRKKRDSGVRRHRKSDPLDEWSNEED